MLPTSRRVEEDVNSLHPPPLPNVFHHVRRLGGVAGSPVVLCRRAARFDMLRLLGWFAAFGSGSRKQDFHA